MKTVTAKQRLTQDHWIILVLGTTLLFGAIARFLPVFQAGFPLNDGGMFLSMIRDLRASHYWLPAVTSYNGLNIPYAYPPFGFYLARVLSDLFKVSEIALIRWLPPTVNTLSILAFNALAYLLLKSRSRAAVASIFYALTPGASAWFIMGGGLTRSFGSLFMLLSLSWVYRLIRDGGKLELGLSLLFCLLTVLSHPEVGIHTAAGCILLWFFYGRTPRATLHGFVVAAATMLLVSPWWLTVISYHGLDPFLSALQTGSYGSSLMQNLYDSFFVGEGFVPVIAVLRSAGAIWAISKRNFFLVLWAVLPHILEPRSAPSVAFYPFCMLMALAITDALPAFLRYFRGKDAFEIGVEFHQRRWVNVGLLLIFVYLFIEGSIYGFRLVNNSLSSTDREVMSWVRENTPSDSRFFSITGKQSPEIDPFVEWFPALAERRNQTTLQGHEWLLGERFFKRYTALANVQGCDSVECVEGWAIQNGLGYDYLLVQNPDPGMALIDSLSSGTKYELVYSTSGALIYRLNK